jgi:hypothetical protein
MFVCRTPARRILPALVVVVPFGLLSAGCHTAQPIATQALIQHQAMIDFSGLAPVQTVESVKVQWAPPQNWRALPEDRSPLYVHQQFKSPSGNTGVGVANVKVPIPLSSRTLIRMAKREYRKHERHGTGRVIDEWFDEFGRHWIEGENDKYYVRAYVVTRGFDAWVVYVGRKVTEPPNAAELSLAVRSLESIIPLPLLARERLAMNDEFSLEQTEEELVLDAARILLLHKVHNPAQAVVE